MQFSVPNACSRNLVPTASVSASRMIGAAAGDASVSAAAVTDGPSVDVSAKTGADQNVLGTVAP